MSEEQKKKLIEIIRKYNSISITQLQGISGINFYKIRDVLIPELIKEKTIELKDNEVRLKKI